MTTWRIAAANTHLYPGARLRCLDAPGAARFATGDKVVVEFSDGNIAMGEIAEASPQSAILHMPAHSTGRGAVIEVRNWKVAAARPPGALRILARA